MPVTQSNVFAARRFLAGGVSLVALMIGAPAVTHAQSLQPSYSPAVNNGGGSKAQRADIIDVTNGASTISGDYNLIGTSARRFQFDSDTIATRNQNGEVISGYDAVAGQSNVVLGTQQKTNSVTYPDQIQGTRVATLVYDNDRLLGVPSTDTRTVTYVDTHAPVYGDLRLANIDNSTVTIATGDKAKSIYDPANFAILTADSGSTLYSVTNGSRVVYDSQTATMDGADQDGLSQAASATVNVPVTTYSGVAFDGGDTVTDLASLKRYNTSQIAQLTAGTITPAQYESNIQAAATTSLRQVTVATPPIPKYTAPPTISERLFIKLDHSNLTTTATSQLVGVVGADGNNDGLSTLILAQNGSTVTNNGTIAQAEGGVGIRVKDAGSSLTNTSTGVIGIGYETLDRSSGVPVPTGLTDYQGYSTGNIAVRATDNATVSNQGIINVANRDIAGHPEDPTFGKANTGIAVSTGATASNSGTILIGGAGSAVANTLGLFGGAAGMVAFNGGTVTNNADGTIRVGTTFAGNAADLATVTDVVSVNYAAGMTSLSGGGTLVNNGLIRIGSLAQNATGMLVGGDGNTALNTGAITIDPSAVTTPSARNVGIWVRGSSVAGAVEATNAASGIITVSGVNSTGLLVENGVAGGSARAINDGTIIVNGGISVDRLRNYGVYVGNASSSAQQNGAVILRGDGAIGVHARNGGLIDVGVSGSVDFQGTNQIGYYTLGAGSRINVASTTNVDTASSTGFRVEDGATLGGANLNLIVSGANAFGIVGSGPSSGTTVNTDGSTINVSGLGATGILIEGGATGTLSGAGTITLAGAGTTAGIVDGQKHALDGTAIGAPIATTTLTSSANLTSSFDNLTGYIARNQGQLTHSGIIAFTGTNDVAILATTGATITNSGTVGVGAGGTAIALLSTGASDLVTGTNTGALTQTGLTVPGGASAVGYAVSGAGASGTNSGTITMDNGIGASISAGGTFNNSGTITVGSGTGILVDGAGSTLQGVGPVSVGNGIAALNLVNGGSVNNAGSFTAGGTAHGVLLSAGSGALTLGNGTVTVSGTGNGIENAAGSNAILLNGTSIVANGSGAAVHTGVAISPASSATLTAAGTNSTGFDFSGTGGAQTANDLTLGTGLSITATGVGATGLRLATTGNAMLDGVINVTNAQGGSAVVGGPAASITNSGTLTSTSTVAPVVDLTGGTIAFTNSGTITAASAGNTAIAGGNNGQNVTLTSGAVTGGVLLGSGNDTFLMTGGTLTGAFDAGAGNNTATFRGLTDANLSGVTRIAGQGTATGTDTLTFDNTTSTGTRRITGWNNVNLINSSGLTADGDLALAGGSVGIDSTSTLYAGNGFNPLISASAGGTMTVNNAGTIDLTNGTSGAGDTLTIRGNYVGQNGTLKLQTVLGSDNSLSDRLVIDGGKASGSTTIQITNAGGLGAATTGNGIEVVGAINGGTTTATTSKDAFTLAGTHVDAGAFQYRLYASDTTGANESWYLRTQTGSGQAEVPNPPTTPTPPTTPSTPAEVITYRTEVPLLAALPDRLRNADLTMLATYHKRMGDDSSEGSVAQGFTVPGRIWGRFIADDGRSRQRGDARATTDGHLYGGQIGIDLFRYGNDKGHHDFGVYGGYIKAKTDVSGFAGGVDGSYVGRLDPTSKYAGLYWTYQANNGFYTDVVLQYSWYGGKAQVANGGRIGINGHGVLASVETGYPLKLSTNWVLEPQAQLIGQGVSINDVAIPNALVTQHTPGYLTGRLGLRLKGRFPTSSGSIQPYVRGNVWKGFSTTDQTLFRTAAATTDILTRNSSLWGEAGGGLTWTFKPGFALYGEGDYRFSLDNGQGVTGHSTSGSVGLKISF
ncbi:MAG: transporter [Sphingomonadales bacterium]|nr:transporter [Sphingomonadales bacterium]